MTDIDAILDRLSGQTVGFHSTRAEKDAQALAAEVKRLRERLADAVAALDAPYRKPRDDMAVAELLTAARAAGGGE